MDNYINTLADYYHLNSKALIIMDKYGYDCILNNESIKRFNIDIITDIKDLFPNIILDPNVSNQQCFLRDSSEKLPIKLEYYPENSHWLIEVESFIISESSNFVYNRKKLHQLFLELIPIDNENDLYKEIVSKASNILNLDRIRILLYNEKSRTVSGSWGIDNHRNIINERNYITDINSNPVLQQALKVRNVVIIEQNKEIINNYESVGYNWNTTSAFFAGDSPVGWITCDNSITNQELPKWKKEILRELNNMTGEQIYNIRAEQHLRD